MVTREVLRKESDKIFKTVYKVVIPEHQARTVQELRVKAFKYSDNAEHNQGLVGRQLHRWLTINDIAKHLDLGHDIAMAIAGDRKKIYFIIKGYLELWLELPADYSDLAIPFEHIARLDNLSDVIYGKLARDLASTAADEASNAWGGGAGKLWSGKVEDSKEIKAKRKDRANGTWRGKPVTHRDDDHDDIPKRTRFSYFFGEGASSFRGIE